MNHLKKNFIFLFFLLIFIVAAVKFSISTVLIFLSKVILAILMVSGLYMSFKMKKMLEFCTFLSLVIVSVLPKLEGRVIKPGFTFSFLFIISYILLCILTVMFTMKVCKNIKFNSRKQKY